MIPCDYLLRDPRKHSHKSRLMEKLYSNFVTIRKNISYIRPSAKIKTLFKQ